MSREQIVERLIAASSGVSSSLLRNPLRMDDEHFAKMGEALDRLQAQSLYIVDKGGLSMDQILDCFRAFGASGQACGAGD